MHTQIHAHVCMRTHTCMCTYNNQDSTKVKHPKFIGNNREVRELQT